MGSKKQLEQSAATLSEKGLISADEYAILKDYFSKNIFSLRNELQALLCVSVLLFTTGCSLLIYENIDHIGHQTVLAGIFFITLVCFFLSIRQSPGFSFKEVTSENAVTDYLVLTGNILFGVFIGYLQFEYKVFGTNYWLATAVPTLVYLISAYFFDHKGVLSLAITGVAAVIGFSASPQGMLKTNFTTDTALTVSAIALGIGLIAWAFYSEKYNFKKHFSFTFQHFAMHFIAIPCLANLYSGVWWLYAFILGMVIYYFYKLAYAESSVLFLFFAIVYGYIGVNIICVRFLMSTHFSTLFIYLSPFYFGGSIVLFIRTLKTFHKQN